MFARSDGSQVPARSAGTLRTMPARKTESPAATGMELHSRICSGGGADSPGDSGGAQVHPEPIAVLSGDGAPGVRESVLALVVAGHRGGDPDEAVCGGEKALESSAGVRVARRSAHPTSALAALICSCPRRSVRGVGDGGSWIEGAAARASARLRTWAWRGGRWRGLAVWGLALRIRALSPGGRLSGAAGTALADVKVQTGIWGVGRDGGVELAPGSLTLATPLHPPPPRATPLVSAGLARLLR